MGHSGVPCDCGFSGVVLFRDILCYLVIYSVGRTVLGPLPAHQLRDCRKLALPRSSFEQVKLTSFAARKAGSLV
jgi:hypothetical protein